MKKVTKEVLLKDYNKFVGKAEELVRQKDFKNALIYVSTCSIIAYNFNFIYSDDRLELILKQTAKTILGESVFLPIKDRYVFYDYFGNTKVLTLQYIRALVSWDVEFLYILESEKDKTNTKDVLDEISLYPKAKIVVLEGEDLFNKMHQAQNEIIKYKPSKALLHLAPWDIIGICVWITMKNVERYLINLTDHAFWIGKSCSDFILEFRVYGYNLSTLARGISKNKLLLQPYYPIQNDSVFAGFPIDVKNKIVGFSGSSFYKIYGRENKFLELIKKVLNEHINFVFLMAGWGIDEPIRKFIEDNKFENRFILLGERKDINQVFKNVDIFINTYPFIGALMTQLAVINKKAIVSYTSSDLSSNFVEDFLNVDKSKAGSIKNEESFFKEINRLIKDNKYRNQNIELYSNSIPSVEEFNDLLWKNLNDTKELNIIDIPSISINFDAIVNLYLEVENNYLKIYQKTKLINLKILYYKHFIISALKCTFLILFYDFKTVKRNVRDHIAKLLILTAMICIY